MTRQSTVIALSFWVAAAFLGQAWAEESCEKPEKALGVSRIVEIDSKAGPLFGEFTKYESEPRFLGPKEVVLTFDDGPMPKYTKPILDALDEYCTKATFFYVGRMAMAYPDMVKEVMGRGHTVGTHTWSHPLNLRRRGLNSAKDQIERGIAAVELAAGEPIAPFFRFPGLSDSGPMLAYLQGRGIAAFTVDVVSNDSYISSPSRLVKRTLQQVERQNGGIILFHDIKKSTARALPTILKELKARGYKVVHLQNKNVVAPLPQLTAALKAKQDKKNEKSAKGDGKPELKPFYAAIATTTLEADDEKPSVTVIAPEARERVRGGASSAALKPPTASEESTQRTRSSSSKRRTRKKRSSTSSAPAQIEPVTSLSAAVRGGR